MSALYIGDDMTVSWVGAKTVSGYLNSATVTWSLRAASAPTTELDTGSLSYQSGTNGTYLGTIEAATTSTLTEGTNYFLDLELTQSGTTGYRRLVCKAQYRRDQ